MQCVVFGAGGRKKTISSVFVRSTEVVKETRKRANGICQYCKQPAPFIDKNGNPYLEVHHKVDYGYLKDTTSMDGAEIDVWVGSGDKKIDAIMCIVDLMKRDSEIKILLGCTEDEKMEIYRRHNETQYMKGILIRR